MSFSVELCDVNKQIIHLRLKGKCELDNVIPMKVRETESDAIIRKWAEMRVANFKYSSFAFLYLRRTPTASLQID